MERIGTPLPPLDLGRAVRLVVSVDLQRYSRHGTVIGVRARRPDWPWSSTGRARPLARRRVRQEKGDGLLLVFPPSVDEVPCCLPSTGQLRTALREVNRELNDHARLRVRVGADRGLTSRADLGWAGQAPIVAGRLGDSKQARDALEDAPEADLVLTVSDAVFRDVFSDDGVEPGPDDFVRVEVDDQDKRFRAPAWVHVAR